MTNSDDTQDNLVEVYRARDTLQAHLFSAELENDGIRSEIVGEQLAGALGDIPMGWSTAPRICVREQDAANARSLLLKYEQQLVDHSQSLNEENWSEEDWSPDGKEPGDDVTQNEEEAGE